MDAAGTNEKAIKEYVRNQIQEAIANDQMYLREFMDLVTGEPVSKGHYKPLPQKAILPN